MAPCVDREVGLLDRAGGSLSQSRQFPGLTLMSGVPPFLPQLTDWPDVTAGLSCCVRCDS